MLKIGITGGIGSGKSTVSKIFEILGIPVYYADDAAKKLMNEDTGLKEDLIKVFGNTIYTNGLLNRPVLAALVFNDAEKLAQLNALVHPATIADAENWMLQQTSAYAIKEAALIFESGGNKNLDKVIGVYCPTLLRLNRVMERDNLPKEAVMARIDKQMPEDEKMKLYDYVLTNDEQTLLIPQVIALHQQLLNLAQTSERV